jgi:hypothetical protein
MVTVAYVDSDGIERTYAVGLEPVLVGRAPECEIRSNDPLVSRKHARLYAGQDGTLFIEDLGSANGVFVGPNRVQISSIPMGAVVVVGSLRFRQLAVASSLAQAPAPAPLEPYVPRRTHAVLMPERGAATPPPEAAPGADAYAMLIHLLDVERKARRTVEDERDAYGARMGELHAQLASATASLATAEARIAELSRTIAELAARLAPGSDKPTG